MYRQNLKPTAIVTDMNKRNDRSVYPRSTGFVTNGLLPGHASWVQPACWILYAINASGNVNTMAPQEPTVLMGEHSDFLFCNSWLQEIKSHHLWPALYREAVWEAGQEVIEGKGIYIHSRGDVHR